MLLSAAAAKLGVPQDLKVRRRHHQRARCTYWTLAGELDLKRSERQREAQAAVRAQVGRQEHPAPRHPEEVHRRRRLRAGRPPARHAVRPRGAPAVARGEAAFGRRIGRETHARRGRRGARRRSSSPSPPSAKSRRSRRAPRSPKSAVWKESATLPPSRRRAVRAHDGSTGAGADGDREDVAHRRRAGEDARKRATRARSRRTARSARRARSRSGPTASSACGRTARACIPLRGDLAKVFGDRALGSALHHAEGAGCYGHNGADDVALDAALLARATSGRPVKLQWMRDDEFMWEPYGSAMVMKLSARRSTRRATSSAGRTSCGAIRTAAARASRRARTRSRRGTWRSRSAPRRCGRRAAAGRRLGPQRDPALRLSQREGRRSTSSSTRRCAPRRCARSAATPTCSRSSRSWTSWPRRPASIRWSSACAT